MRREAVFLGFFGVSYCLSCGTGPTEGTPAAGGTPNGSGGSSSGGLGAGGSSSGGLAAGGLSSGGQASGGLSSGGQTGMTGGSFGSGGDGGCAPFEMPTDCSIPDGAVLPGELRCSGLYEDVATRTLRCDIQAYAPAFVLYSDRAEKSRYVALPPDTKIDVSDPDDFVFPVGTKFWKEFWVGAEGAKKIGETRLLQKSELGWIYTTYVWDEAGTTAIQENDGVDDLFGTGHSVPSREQCKSCHGGRLDFVLGWDAFLLGVGGDGVPGSTGITLSALDELGLLADSAGKDAALTAQIPGDAVEREALAYLHVNCGVSCHNENTNAAGRPSGLFLRLEQGELSDVHATDAATSGMNRSPSPNAELTGLPEQPLGYYDLRPLDPARSLVTTRMNFRGSPVAMPPLGTHEVDAAGVALITDWIAQMTEERGYPAPAP